VQIHFHLQEHRYPPAITLNWVFTSSTPFTWTTSVSDSTVGNGDYVVKQTSIWGDYGVWRIFGIPDGMPAVWGAWYDGTGKWRTSYNSPEFTLDGLYYGDWVSIQMPTPIIFTRCTIRGRGGFPGATPGKFRIYGSRDGSTWFLLYDQSSTKLSYPDSVGTVTLSTSNAYPMFGLVVSELQAAQSNVLMISEWNIYGKVLPLFVNLCKQMM
jgi:hypothetical protein